MISGKIKFLISIPISCGIQTSNTFLPMLGYTFWPNKVCCYLCLRKFITTPQWPTHCKQFTCSTLYGHITRWMAEWDVVKKIRSQPWEHVLFNWEDQVYLMVVPVHFAHVKFSRRFVLQAYYLPFSCPLSLERKHTQKTNSMCIKIMMKHFPLFIACTGFPKEAFNPFNFVFPHTYTHTFPEPLLMAVCCLYASTYSTS